MKKILTLAIGMIAICQSQQVSAQENTENTKSSFISLSANIQEGDYATGRLFIAAKTGFEISENSWIGPNLSFDRQEVIQFSSFSGTTTTDISLLGLGGFYRIKHPIADKFSLTNDVEANVYMNLDDSEAPKLIQGLFTFDAEYNPTPSLGLRLGIGEFSITTNDGDTFIDLNYLFNSPRMSLLFYF